MTWPIRFRAVLNSSARSIHWSPASILALGTNHRGLHAFQDNDHVEVEVEGLGRLAIVVKDDLKRTWPRETRLQRQNNGLDPMAPQLSGKHAKA